MANPITECDRMQSYAAPDPPLGVVAGCAAADQRRRPELAILCHWK